MSNNIVIISGYFNPIHPGHISMVKDIKTKNPNSKLFVIVNNDYQVRIKGAVPFLDQLSRCYILENIKGVDEVFLSIDKDSHIVKSLEYIYTKIKVDNKRDDCTFFFYNGGDRDESSSAKPEIEFCNLNGIRLEYGVGDDKRHSSSTLIENSCKWFNNKNIWHNFANDLLSELDIDNNEK